MRNIPNNIPANLRVDYSRADQYIRPEPPKLTFWQKLGRGVGKFMSFAGPIGAAAAAIALPGIGLPIAAGLYGLTRVSQDQLYKAQVKDQIAQSAQAQPTSISMPGLFETGGFQPGQVSTDFMAPERLEPAIGNMVIDRNAAHQEAVMHFS